MVESMRPIIYKHYAFRLRMARAFTTVSVLSTGIWTLLWLVGHTPWELAAFSAFCSLAGWLYFTHILNKVLEEHKKKVENSRRNGW